MQPNTPKEVLSIVLHKKQSSEHQGRQLFIGMGGDVCDLEAADILDALDKLGWKVEKKYWYYELGED